MSRARDRHRRRNVRRKENLREVRPRFLIVCEDGKSAPNYFRSFRVTSAQIITVGAGMHTLQLVEQAVRCRQEYGLSEGKDQTWVVMDRNSFPQDDYDNAFHKAKATGILVAFANECFEVWVHLHFRYSTARVARARLPRVLSDLLGVNYEKGMETLYDLLSSRQHDAISNATKLIRHHQDTSDGALHNCCPSTNVQSLVSKLNKYL